MQQTTQNEKNAAGSGGDTETIGAALGRIPSGLFVISWRDQEADRAMLASWVMQAGFLPPAISVAMARSRGLIEALAAGSPFVVNVLAEAQRSLLSRFGKPTDEPFAGLDVVRTPTGCAAIAGAAAWLECRELFRADGPADHLVVVAEVIGGSTPENAQPLVHLRRNGLRY
jgi:flavin reductase (DIM6/NTAB) family NADH-FMN oxidoreductase RutF